MVICCSGFILRPESKNPCARRRIRKEEGKEGDKKEETEGENSSVKWGSKHGFLLSSPPLPLVHAPAPFLWPCCQSLSAQRLSELPL